MHWKLSLKRGLQLIGVLLISYNICAQVKLPRLISDGMVLQRDVTIKIWGWASPGEVILIKFKQNDYSAVTDSDGNWSIELSPQIWKFR
ncbi:hypothetical protein ES705_22554 [subsurface metagenome]